MLGNAKTVRAGEQKVGGKLWDFSYQGKVVILFSQIIVVVKVNNKIVKLLMPEFGFYT